MSTGDHIPEASDADHPWPTIKLPTYPFLGSTFIDFAENIAGEMSVTHNAIIRSLNSLWHNAILIPSREHDSPIILGYIGYALTALKAIQQHHDAEEEVFFPAMQHVGMNTMVEENTEQHRAFHDAMQTLKVYLEGVQAGSQEYDGQKMRELLREFADPLVKHLHDEIPTIRPEIMHKIDKTEMQKMSRALMIYNQSQEGLFSVVPFMLTAHDQREAPNWPPFPRILTWLGRNAIYRWHSSYWQFAPYDLSGEPQRYSAPTFK
ncbi:hypothetical protein DFP72DRAFT_903238 [Ephemerocybe angulata]|uniref:Hemerythrin-like domain-containing protein n=1 Tax=Ephemerocybe angulata TaxID=980116 RepID=A0A8H6HTQ7_9AGAR|nr:hypothetical protein DFP72DRAFT_903238 [Tulosesus angulatus]